MIVLRRIVMYEILLEDLREIKNIFVIKEFIFWCGGRIKGECVEMRL